MAAALQKPLRFFGGALLIVWCCVLCRCSLCFQVIQPPNPVFAEFQSKCPYCPGPRPPVYCISSPRLREENRRAAAHRALDAITAHSRCVLLSPVSGFLAGSVVSAVSSGTIITTGVDGEAVTVNDTTIDWGTTLVLLTVTVAV